MSLLPIFLILAGGLIGYRTGKMVTSEEGPFSIFSKIRGLDSAQKTWIGRGLHCPFCVSFWTSLLGVCLVAFPFTDFNALQLAAYWLAASGLASLLFSWEFKS